MRTTRRAILAGAAACALALAGTSPASGQVEDDPAARPGTRRPVTIGLIEQRTGGFVAPEFGTAFEATVDYVNAERRGINGHPIEVDVCVTDVDPATAVACAQRFAADPDVHLVVESTTNPHPIADVLAPTGKPLMAGGVDLGAATRPGVFVFDPGTAGITHAMLSFAATRRNVRDVTVFHADDPAIAQATPMIDGIAGLAGVDVENFVPLAFQGDLTETIRAGTSAAATGAMFIVAPSQCQAVADALDNLAYALPVFIVELCLTDDLVASGATDGWYAGTQSLASVANGGDEAREARRILRRYGPNAETGGLAGLGMGYAWAARDVLATAGGVQATDASVTTALSRYSSTGVLGFDKVRCPGPVPFTGACNPSTLMTQARAGTVRDVGGWTRTNFAIFAALGGPPPA